jgi:hypothetical protein
LTGEPHDFPVDCISAHLDPPYVHHRRRHGEALRNVVAGALLKKKPPQTRDGYLD